MVNRRLYQIFKPIISRRPFLKKLIFSYGMKALLFPKVLTLVLTYRCQCRCVHCGVSDNHEQASPELSTEEIMKLLDEAATIGMIMQITFTGGEPLLRKDIFDLIRYSKKHRFFTKIDSNGALLETKSISRLKEAGLDRIGISIDHYRGEIHDQLRRYNGLFHNIMEVVKICASLKLSVYFQTYATHTNIRNGDLEKTIQLAKKTPVDKIKIQPIAILGSSMKAWEDMLTSHDFTLLHQMMARHTKAYVESEFLSPLEHKRFCRVNFKSNIHVTCYGEVQPCCWFPASFGNVRKKTLKDILNFMYSSPDFKKLLGLEGCLCSNQEVLDMYFGKDKKLPIKMHE